MRASVGPFEVGAGVQGAARRVERVTGAASVSVDGLLDASPASVEGVAGEADHVEGIHDGGRVGQFLGGGGLEPGEPIHRDDLDSVAPCLVAFGQPLLECLLGAPFDHVEQPGRPCPVADAGQVDDDGDVLVAAAGVAPVGSAWGAVSGLLPVRFPRPPAEPDVRLSPHPALHERGLVQLVVTAGRSQGVGMW